MIPTIIVSFLGILAGLCLAKISPEELEPGKPHFERLKLILFISIIITSLFIFSLQVNFILLGIIAFYIIVRYIRQVHLALDYILFAIILASITNPNHLHITASLVFLYGLPAGTLLTRK